MTLLYVDDDEDDREIFCEAVSTLNFKILCITAAGGREALDVLEKRAVDIVFLDYRMPGMDGRTFLEELSHLSITKPRVYLYAALLLDFEMDECRKLGALDCFEKPGNIKEIAALLSKIMSHE